jgi:hypothetical protein
MIAALTFLYISLVTLRCLLASNCHLAAGRRYAMLAQRRMPALHVCVMLRALEKPSVS